MQVWACLPRPREQHSWTVDLAFTLLWARVWWRSHSYGQGSGGEVVWCPGPERHLSLNRRRERCHCLRGLSCPVLCEGVRAIDTAQAGCVPVAPAARMLVEERVCVCVCVCSRRSGCLRFHKTQTLTYDDQHKACKSRGAKLRSRPAVGGSPPLRRAHALTSPQANPPVHKVHEC